MFNKVAYSGGSYENLAIKTQHRPFPGMSNISTWGSPVPFKAKRPSIKLKFVEIISQTKLTKKSTLFFKLKNQNVKKSNKTVCAMISKIFTALLYIKGNHKLHKYPQWFNISYSSE